MYRCAHTIALCVCDPFKEHVIANSLQTFYTLHILGVIIIIARFTLSPNVLFILKIASLNVFFSLRSSVLCIWLSNEGIKH